MEIWNVVITGRSSFIITETGHVSSIHIKGQPMFRFFDVTAFHFELNQVYHCAADVAAGPMTK